MNNGLDLCGNMAVLYYCFIIIFISGIIILYYIYCEIATNILYYFLNSVKW